MSRKITYTIKSIKGGLSPFSIGGAANQYDTGASISTELPVGGAQGKMSGAIVPVGVVKSTKAVTDAAAMWLIVNPKNTKMYGYLTNGKVIQYDGATYDNDILIGTPTSGAGNGGAYYNNYIYFFTTTDVSRYGPLNNSPTLVNGVWTGATLGTQTALTNTTYPSIAGAVTTPVLPNHAPHLHSDGALYFCDFKDGVGMIHKIKTTKTTDEGDTDDGSSYNVLDLPVGYYPTDIESFGTDLVISAIQTVDNTMVQGKSALFFWDTIESSFYQQVPVEDVYITALLMTNGSLHVFSGNNYKFRLSKYNGGEVLQNLISMEEGNPPFQGAVNAFGGQIFWAMNTVKVSNGSDVFSYGSKDKKFSPGLHSVMRSSETSSSGRVITAIRQTRQQPGGSSFPFVAWKSNADQGGDIYVASDAGVAGVVPFIRWEFNIGKKFKINKIMIPLADDIDTNTSIGVKVYFDNRSSNISLTGISKNLFPEGDSIAVYKAPFNTDGSASNYLSGTQSFELELTFQTFDPIVFPIRIELETFDDQQAYG